MPSVLSTLKDRIYGREWSFPYNCYEVGHAWTPICSDAAASVGVTAFGKALPLYTTLYLFTQLGLQRNYSPNAFKETVKSILTSSFFLSFNVFSGMCLSCVLRNNSDRYYYRVQCLLPGFISSYFSLLIERPSRRPALAFYLANMSSEMLYKYLVSERYLVPIPHGETLLFAIGMSCWLRFVRIHGFSHDPVSTALKFLIGPLEAKSRARIRQIEVSANDECIVNGSANGSALLALPDERHQLKNLSSQNDQTQQNAQELVKVKREKKSILQTIDDNINNLLNNYFDCYHVCPHKGVSCLNYTLSPLITRFFMGYMGRSVMNIATNHRLLLESPRRGLIKSFTSKNSVDAGLFLGSLVGVSRLAHCSARRWSGKQEVWHSSLAGGIAGLSMLFSPKSTLSTYVIWKCLEQYFFLAVENGTLVRANECIGLVYATSINILLYMFAIEPRFIRPSYMKFIDNISDHRLHQLNRMVLDVFGPRASQGYEDWFPDLDPKYMSREFQELIFNWLIQPH